MRFSQFGLAACAADWKQSQQPLSEPSSCDLTWSPISACEAAVFLYSFAYTMPVELISLKCNQISSTLDIPIFHNEDAKLNMWSLFQAHTTPKCLVRPQSAADVAGILAVAREHECHFAILGGGTSPFKGASNAQGGITVDLSLLKLLELDADSTEITVGGGSIWADVYRFLDPRKLSAAGTRNSLVGVAGSVLGGGISFFSHNHGWACDNVKRFKVVLANSSIVHASEAEHPDLFWALRGGGNNFGVVTSLTLEVFSKGRSFYTFQRWSIDMLESAFERLEALTNRMPSGIEMVATTLGWNMRMRDFAITERLVASELPDLPQTLPVPASMLHRDDIVSTVLDQRVYLETTLAMAQKLERMNAAGFFNYFGSITVRNNLKAFMAIAEIFREEVFSIQDAAGLQLNIVYNPLTVPTIEKMARRGGNALGIMTADGPLTIVNINLHWGKDRDTERMRCFMRRLLWRFREATRSLGLLNPYLFQNHAFDEDDIFTGYGPQNYARLLQILKLYDPEGILTRLQPGFHKLR